MESLNAITLAGKVSGLDPRNRESSRSMRFTLTTNQMYLEDGVRHFDPERHLVKLLDSRTIGRYIKPGKNIVLTGRLKYSPDGAYVLAEKMHFPGGGTDGE